MMSFQQVLAQYAAVPPALGSAGDFPVDSLRADLASVIRSNGRYFFVIFSLLVALLVLAVAVLAKFLDQPAKAAALLTASGVSIPFILRMMARMWESKIKAEALLVLATSLDAKLLRTVVVSLAQPVKVDSVQSATTRSKIARM